MMTKRNLYSIAIFFFFANLSFSQTSKWENFTDFKKVTSIASDNAGVTYCASSGGLFAVDPASGKVISKYTNLNGLINNDLTALTIDNNEKLWTGASDGSIAILNLHDFTWKYIYDIKNSNETNKSINYLYYSSGYIFAATGYGIQKISAANYSFVDAPYYKLGLFPINTPVYGLTINSNILYAATKSGVAYGNYISSNLNNPSSWTNFNGLELGSDVKTIETFNNQIFAGSPAGFDYFDGTTWLPYPNSTVSNSNTQFIKSVSNKIYFICNNTIYSALAGSLSTIAIFLDVNNYSTLANNNLLGIIPGLTDNGILVNGNFVFPNSPYTNNFNQITIDDDNNVWAAGGTGNAGFYKFDGNIWENFNTASHPEIGSSNWFQKIAYGNGNVWALGFGGGPTLIQGNTIINYNPSNSVLPGISNDPTFCAAYGGAYDNNQVFWVTFFSTNSGKSLYAFFNNQWIGFVNPSIIGSATLSNVAVDSYNTKWIVSSGSRSGVYFFNENGTLTNPNDDVFGFYDNTDLGSDITNVTDVIVERNGEVWIATNNGVSIINNPLGAVQNPSQKPPAQKLGIISGNLKVPFTETCISLTNDILNDKWIGTETNGVFHLSPDGSTLIEQLNTKKTPILSDKITTIAVSDKSGRAFFGTLGGMSSYLTDAIEPVQNFDKIIASPNPYLVPSSTGLKIDGLIENSKIKIITLNGEIIDEFDSPGGRIAFWDGKNGKNEFASTGIYIIVAYNKDGSKVGTGKVAVVQR